MATSELSTANVSTQSAKTQEAIEIKDPFMSLERAKWYLMGQHDEIVDLFNRRSRRVSGERYLPAMRETNALWAAAVLIQRAQASIDGPCVRIMSGGA